MLICVHFDHYSGPAVATINGLRNDPRLSSGFCFLGTLDHLAATSGFVCFRCKEPCTSAADDGPNKCWIFQLNGNSEVAQAMSILFNAKMYNVSVAANSRSLIQNSRVICDDCRRLERPLQVEEVRNGSTHSIEAREIKPIVGMSLSDNFEISDTDDVLVIESSPIVSPNNVVAQQDVSLGLEFNQQTETKPLAVEPVNTSSPLVNQVQLVSPPQNLHHQIITTLQQIDRRHQQEGAVQDVSIEEYSPHGHSFDVTSAPQNTIFTRTNGYMLIKQEHCEAHLRTAAADSFNRNAATQAAPVQQTLHIKHSSSIHEDELQLRTVEGRPESDSEDDQGVGYWSRVMNMPRSPQAIPEATAAGGQRLSILDGTSGLPGNSAGTTQHLFNDSQSHQMDSRSLWDIKVKTWPRLQLNPEQQPSHFDFIASSGEMNNIESLFAPPTSTGNHSLPGPWHSNTQVGHSHLSTPADIKIETLLGYLPLWKVNHTCTQFHRVNIADINPSSRLRFHSSILKRKKEEWVSARVSAVKKQDGSLIMTYRHEMYCRPGQWSVPKRLKVCCDSLSHFILVHSDDLTYRD